MAQAAPLAVATVKEFVQSNPGLAEVRFVVFSDSDRLAYEPLLQ